MRKWLTNKHTKHTILRIRSKWWVGLLGIIGFGLLPLSAGAHEIRPALAQLTFTESPRFELALSVNLEALLARIGPQHNDSRNAPQAREYDHLRGLSAAQLRKEFLSFESELLQGMHLEFDGQPVPLVIEYLEIPEVGDVSLARLTTIYFSADRHDTAQVFRWRYAADFGTSVLRIHDSTANNAVTAWWLQPGQLSQRYRLGEAQDDALAVFPEFLQQGFLHILPLGLDHILFVVGLFLLSAHWRPLLWQVTVFTVAHSITLALSIYGIVNVPGAWVEPLIAASIVYIAVENLIASRLHTFRLLVVFLFGLLHGLGFAGVLQELGLPAEQAWLALLAFNVGVEFGQLAVIALAYAVVYLGLKFTHWERRRVVVPASSAIALVAVYWTVQRIAF